MLPPEVPPGPPVVPPPVSAGERFQAAVAANDSTAAVAAFFESDVFPGRFTTAVHNGTRGLRDQPHLIQDIDQTADEILRGWIAGCQSDYAHFTDDGFAGYISTLSAEAVKFARLRVMDPTAAEWREVPLTVEPATLATALPAYHLGHLLDEAVAQLSDADRAIVLGYYFRGMSVGEIAEGIGMSESYVTHRRPKILARLRADIERAADPGG